MITGVILARNEEHNIVECIEALRPHVAEIILINMESTDGTVALARPLVDLVLEHPLVANFDAARNVAITSARHDWLWFVDADERVPAETGHVVREFLAKHGRDFEAISIPFKSYFCGKWIEHCGWWPGYTMPRVLKRGHFRFSERLHGGVEFDGREARIPPNPQLGVDHYSYRSIEHYLEKLNRYTSTEAAQMAAQGRQWDWRSATAHMVHDLWNYYEVNRGGLDGEHGWILSWLSAQYRWLQHAKLLDIAAPAPLDHGAANIPSSLDDVLLFMQEELSALRAARPQLPLGIVWRSPVWDYSGYADESRAFVKALAAGTRDLAAEEIRWSDRTCTLTPSDTRFFRAVTGRRRAPATISITNCIPSLVSRDRCAAINVLRTTFETDRIPAEWLPGLSQFDEIWLTSRHAERSFRRSGVAPERMRVVPSCVDTELFRPEGPRRPRPHGIEDRFLFLSVMEWQLRKGWDVLLRAYVRAFPDVNSAALLIKYSCHHGQSEPAVLRDIDEMLSTVGTSLVTRPDIVLSCDTLSSEDMAALYRSADAFVLPTRGEGWGRPYLEAMACGIPVLATRTSGQLEFLSDENCLFVGGAEAAVSAAAARELPIYSGHRWFDPDETELAQALRRIHEDRPLRERLVAAALDTVSERFDLTAGEQALETAITVTENRFFPAPPAPAKPDALRIELEGELFAGHSFSNINEQIAMRLADDDGIRLSIARKFYNPTDDQAALDERRLLGYVGRDLAGPAELVIRHAFPPNFEPPRHGKWVHIQPWEFGYLPRAWVPPLCDHVDEIWAPSQYVRRVYQRSGIPAEKIHVIPWGMDERVFSPAVPPLHLATRKRCKLLFVGGTIARKGFDQLLEAYCAEFTREDDVCLVIKDVGTQTFYRFGNCREEILRRQADKQCPEILYFDGPMTAGQRASLYAACNCLAAPYRGEGFGLPVLEAMACGLPVIVPRGGPTDDFVTQDAGWLLDADETTTEHEWPLAGPALEFSIRPEVIRHALREVYSHGEEAERRGTGAAVHAARYTWDRSVAAMRQRVEALLGHHSPTHVRTTSGPSIAAIVQVKDERLLAGCVARLRPMVDEVHVWGEPLSPRALAIAAEYGAQATSSGMQLENGSASAANWLLHLSTDDWLTDSDTPFLSKPEQLRELLRREPLQTEVVNIPLGRTLGKLGQAFLTLRRVPRGEQTRKLSKSVTVFHASGTRFTSMAP